MIRYPNISGKTDAQKLEQMQSYLHQLVDELNYQLDTSSNNSSSYSASVADKAAVAKSTKNDDAISKFNDIKALIIKSADIVNAYSEEINKKLEGQYVAESDFGTFKEATEAQLTASSQQINVVMTKQEDIDTDMEDLERTLRSEIEQTADSIKLEVDGGEPGNTAYIKLTVGDKKYEGEIDLTGLVTFTNLKTKGQTVINGSNITTGEILADLIKTGQIRSAVLVDTGDGVGIDLDGGEIVVRVGDYATRIVPNSLQSYYYGPDYENTRRYRIGSLHNSYVTLNEDEGANSLRHTQLGCNGYQYLTMIDYETDKRLDLQVDGDRVYLSGLTAPVSDSDAVNKAYVDGKFAPIINIGTYTGDIDSLDIPVNSVAWITPNTVNNPRSGGYAVMETFGPSYATRIQRLTYYDSTKAMMERMYTNGKWYPWATKDCYDSVSAQGTSGIWTYRKWSSGLAECWCKRAYSVTTKANSAVTLELGDALPFAFTQNPIVHMSPTEQTAYQHWFGAVHANTSQLAYAVVYAFAAKDVTGTAMVSVVGRWK